MAKGLNRETEILEYISLFFTKRKYMPTIKDICFDCKINKSTLDKLLKELVIKERLIRLPTGTIPYKIMGMTQWLK